MMLKLMWSLSLLCAAGCQVSLVARPGQNVSLTCNLTSGLEVLWVRLRSARLLPLLAVQESKLGADTVNVLQGDGGRLGNGGRLAGGGVALHILDVQQEDGGLYCCIGRTGDGWTHRELQLTVNGDDGHAGAVQRPCWTLGVCVLPAAIVFGCLVCVGGVYLCSGKGVCRLSGSVSDLQTEALHYSSLKLPAKPRPSGRGGSPLVEESVIYSTVANQKPAHRARDLR